jgi:hypothetical protein
MEQSSPPCIVCGAALTGLFPDINQPSGATAFQTTGHYGSTVFDPMDGSAIEINVCDSCLTAKATEGAVRHYTPKPQQMGGKMSVWTGPNS